MKPLKIGLLPCYIKLYDDANPGMRKEVEKFQGILQAEFENRGVTVEPANICRLQDEFCRQVRQFEQADVDGIVTVHLAYSPSLEAVDALCGTSLPLLLLDTTPSENFNPGLNSETLLFNHGIHGVQDLCNLLRRRHRPFDIEAGHWAKSDLMDRALGWIRAAHMKKTMRRLKVGRIGQPFRGMGDFQLPPGSMERLLGIHPVEITAEKLATFGLSVTSAELQQEAQKDRARFGVECFPKGYSESLHAGLAVRSWLKTAGLNAFTMNFLDIHKVPGLSTVPFLEASKQLAEGVGYAGEGDVLTAALVAALFSVFPETTFVEMFCPDWAQNRVFVSHMGEINLRLCERRPVLRQIPFPYTEADPPVIACGRYRGGEATLVNLAPAPDDRLCLTLAPVTMLGTSETDRMQDTIRGWFQPPVDLPSFLESYSRGGATHHSALVYGSQLRELVRFGRLMGWETRLIGA